MRGYPAPCRCAGDCSHSTHASLRQPASRSLARPARLALDATTCVGRGCPCHLAGRSLRASCPALTPRKLASASCLSLACKASEIARATPPSFPHKSPGREPGDCGTEGHPACHAAHPADAAPDTRGFLPAGGRATTAVDTVARLRRLPAEFRMPAPSECGARCPQSISGDGARKPQPAGTPADQM